MGYIMSIESGAINANKCLGVTSDDKVCIVSDNDTLEVAKAIEKTSKAITKSVTLYILENYGERPLPNVPEEIENAVLNSTAVFLPISKKANKKINETHTIRRALRTLVGQNNIRCTSMPGINTKVLEQGLATDPEDVWAFSQSLNHALSSSRSW